MSTEKARIYQETGWAVHQGQRRTLNEDSVVAVDMNMVDSSAEKSVGIYAVADGMGGEAHGEIASSAAVQTMVDQLVQRISAANGAASDDYRRWLEQAVHAANDEIYGDQRDMGTTIVAAIIVGHTVYIANVGDSRAYILTPDGMQQITEDQSLVQALVNSGQISAEQAMHHPHRNVLQQAVGKTERVVPDLYTAHIDVNHYLLLCSDGLTNELDEASIYDIVTQADSPQVACDLLVDKANEHGGRDNISVIVVRLTPDA